MKNFFALLTMPAINPAINPFKKRTFVLGRKTYSPVKTKEVITKGTHLSTHSMTGVKKRYCPKKEDCKVPIKMERPLEAVIKTGTITNSAK